MDNQGVFVIVIVIVIVTVIVSVTVIVTVIVIVIIFVADIIIIVTVTVNFDGNPLAFFMISPGNCPGGSFRTIAGEAIVQEAASGQLPGF